jgi:HEAT repeat protein
MIVRALPVLLIFAAVGAGAIGTAITMNPPSMTPSQSDHWERSRPGPDSGRVAILIEALGRGDPVVCELIGDQLGNFWWGGDRAGVGRLAAVSMSLQAAKDSIGGRITDERAIKRLIAELDGSSPCTRRVSSKLLGHSAIAAAQLNALLSDASANVRESAALAAGTGDRHDAVPSLERALDDKTPAVAAMAAWALGEIEDRASLPKLLKLVRAGDTRVRLAAIWALGQLEDNRAVQEIVTTLRDSNAAIRAMSADVLGDIEDTDAIGPLESVLARDDDASVRIAAAGSLGEISAASSAPSLVRAFADA